MRQETPPSALLSLPWPALLYVLAVFVLGAAAARALVHAHEDRMHLSTGPAEWIWYSSRVPEPRPLRFYATRDFVLPRAPSRATARLFVDSEHALYINGERLGGRKQRRGDPLAVYDAAPLLREGVNRVAVEAASPTGIGGILFSLDLDSYGRNALVSDGGWKVDPSPDGIVRGARFAPVVWGRPPQYPWGYPRLPGPAETR